MSDEHDSWFQDVFGVNLGGAAKRIEDEARAAKAQVTNVVQTVQKKVDGAIDDVVGGLTGVVKKVAGVAGGGGAGGGGAGGGSPKTGAPAGGGTGKFPLSGSVGRGGQNAPNDVKAVQRALGLSDDGQCGTQTITAIENFQRSIGQAKPDSRVDAGGATERALAGGGKHAPEPVNMPGEDDAGGLLGKALDEAKGFASGLAGLGDRIPPGVLDDPKAALNDFSLGGGGMRLTLNNLSKEQIDDAKRFLRTHAFGPIHMRATGQVADDYDPFFDGKATDLPSVVVALKSAIEPLPLQDPTEGLRNLVDEEFRRMRGQEMKQASARAAEIVRRGAKVDPNISREQAAKDLTKFLEKVLKAQGGKDLRVTDPVRAAGHAVARGLAASDAAIQSLLNGKALPGRPGALADAMAKCLPPTIPRENVEALDRIPVKDTSAKPQSLVEILGDALAKELEGLIKLLPQFSQDAIRDAVKDSVEEGITAAVEQALSESRLEDKDRERIKKIVEAAIKQKVK